MRKPLNLLTAAEMAKAEQRAVAAGVPMPTLMENAGRAVAEEAALMVPRSEFARPKIAVLCGPGNNGGDGFVAARYLAIAGYIVKVFTFKPIDQLKGDAAAMAKLWTGPTAPLEEFRRPDFIPELTIDALFGTGFNRPLSREPAGGDHARVAHALTTAKGPRLAVDLPSGVNSDTGEKAIWTPRMTKTVTFANAKVGHYLYPGKWATGDLVVRDIGIPEWPADEVWWTRINSAGHSRGLVPEQGASLNKYSRGHAVVVSGPAESTGAARLAARGALRIGAGLVTVASPRDALAVNAAQLTAIMVRPFDPPEGLGPILADKRRNAVLIGPGCGVGAETRRMVEIALGSGAAVVLDADALTSFEGASEALFSLTRKAAGESATDLGKMVVPRAVLTPHEGEFKRLFPDLDGSKLERARAAAKLSHAVVVLKGPDTVIADPSGYAEIGDNAPAYLATAGSGDVLAGFILGCLAHHGNNEWACQMAACDGVWLHGECANAFGPGLIAEDLPEMLPRVLARLVAEKGRS